MHELVTSYFLSGFLLAVTTRDENKAGSYIAVAKNNSQKSFELIALRICADPLHALVFMPLWIEMFRFLLS
jgi:hypothetical protein